MCLEQSPCATPGCPRTTSFHLTDFCSTPDCTIILHSYGPYTGLCDACAGLKILFPDSQEADQQPQPAGQSVLPYHPLNPPTSPQSTQLYGETPLPPASVAAKRNTTDKGPAREASTALETIQEQAAGRRGEVAPEPAGAGGPRRNPPRKRASKYSGGGTAGPSGSRG